MPLYGALHENKNAHIEVQARNICTTTFIGIFLSSSVNIEMFDLGPINGQKYYS